MEIASFTIDKSSPIPYYYQVEEWLRKRIASGELRPGDAIESEISLAERLGVSRITIRQALKDLTDAGLLVRRRALGTIVAETRKAVLMTRSHLRGLTEEMAAEGLVVRSKVLEQRVLTIAGEVQHELGLAPGVAIIFIRRLRSVNGEPLCIESCYHPAQYFPGLEKMDLNDCSIYEILESNYQHKPVLARDTIVADTADRDLATNLHISYGAAVMRFRRIAWDRQGNPVEFTISNFRADRHQFVIEYRS